MYSLTCQCLINNLNLQSWERSLLWVLKVMVSFSTSLINPCPSHFPFLLAPDLTSPDYLVIACLFLHFLHSQIWIACPWLSHLCSLPAVSLWMSPFHPALSTVHNFLLQHCEIQNTVIYDLEIIHSWRGWHFFMPQWLFIWPRAINRERWERKWKCQEVPILVFSCSEEFKPPREMRILFSLAFLHLNSTGDL